jgi:hypothetical protein
MTVVMRDYHGHEEELTDPVQAGEVFDDQVSSIMPHGESGQVLWFGPADGEPAIRVDIDIDRGRAAMRWIADGTYAVDLEPGEPITVMESADGDLATIPASLARVRPETVRAAVIEYATTGARSTAVNWRSPGVLAGQQTRPTSDR